MSHRNVRLVLARGNVVQARRAWHEALGMPLDMRWSRERRAELQLQALAHLCRALEHREAARRGPCSWCHGSGFVNVSICQECRGTG